jgi:hypothetical protein
VYTSEATLCLQSSLNLSTLLGLNLDTEGTRAKEEFTKDTLQKKKIHCKARLCTFEEEDRGRCFFAFYCVGKTSEGGVLRYSAGGGRGCSFEVASNTEFAICPRILNFSTSK